MTKLTLEDLAERLARLERDMNEMKVPLSRVPQLAVRTDDDLAFARAVDAEGVAWREQERRAELEILDHETAS